MIARRFAIIGGVLAAAGGAIVVACTFPEVNFAATDGSTTDGSTVDGSTTDGSKPSDVDPDGVDAEAGLVDVVVVDASNCCDCDKDDYLANAADASCGDAGPKGDCDDAVNAVHPDAGFVSNKEWLSTHQPKFDWNCDGNATKQLNHDLKCPGSAINCSGEGFQDNPPCGEESNYFICAVENTVGCGPSSVGNRTQACR